MWESRAFKRYNMESSRKRILACASLGGHLVQLLRIIRPIEGRCEVTYVTTSPDGCPSGCDSSHHHWIPDFSRRNPLVTFAAFRKCWSILDAARPDAVITTGAAPGLVMLFAARLKGIPTLWIDSIANANELSMSGRIASRIASRTLTQWPHLANDGIEYHGPIL